MTKDEKEDGIPNDDKLHISTALLRISTEAPKKPRKSKVPQKRISTPQEREKQLRIDKENRILLRKILEQHHGIRRRSSSVPPPTPNSNKPISSRGPSSIITSNQINAEKKRQKRDYENLLLLQKIQNAKPSSSIADSFKKPGRIKY